MNRSLALLAAATLSACGEARPPADGSASASGGTCPTGVDATLSSIDLKLLKVICTACHAGSLAASSGGLDLSGSAYAALVNVPANNIAADPAARPPALLRVRPGDPAGSLLYQKLLISTTPSPQFGQGMPLTAPGSVCEPVREAIRAWIAGGAPDD